MTGPPTNEELRAAVQALLEEGKLVAVEEIDPETGEIRMRYYHRDYAPKPN